MTKWDEPDSDPLKDIQNFAQAMKRSTQSMQQSCYSFSQALNMLAKAGNISLAASLDQARRRRKKVEWTHHG